MTCHDVGRLRALVPLWDGPRKANPVCDVECRDEGMLAGLDEYIKAHPKGDILIVLHQMGNHGPAYYKRYPKEFEKFTPVCRSNQLQECSREEIVNAYDNTLLYTDHVLSQVISLLKKHDDTFETAMFYMSDHGELLGDHGLLFKGCRFFEGLVHVPLIVSWPRSLLEGTVSRALVELVDVAPTLLELSGIPIPDSMQGRSLAALLQGRGDVDTHKRVVVSEYNDAMAGGTTWATRGVSDG